MTYKQVQMVYVTIHLQDKRTGKILTDYIAKYGIACPEKLALARRETAQT